jgi:hypothetical protein
MYIRWINFKCPFCSATWSSRIVSAPRPDKEFRTCSKCDREFKTHDIEWAHMARKQKATVADAENDATATTVTVSEHNFGHDHPGSNTAHKGCWWPYTHRIESQ